MVLGAFPFDPQPSRAAFEECVVVSGLMGLYVGFVGLTSPAEVS